ncbi:hypothetical protein L6R49_05540 [Myxococcota bacterium]|nr:hypothetical protein [Myxococcota bacterium]
MSLRSPLWVLFGLTAAAPACSSATPRDRVEPTFIMVSVLDGEVGSGESPLPFSSEATTRRMRVELLDIDQQPWTMTGDLTVEIKPGNLTASPWVSIDGSSIEVDVSFKNGFGPTRVWFSDLGDKDIDSGRKASFATGVSEPIWFTIPTLGEINRTDDHETNQLAQQFTEVRCLDRDVRVTTVGTDGFWVTDLSDPEGSYNSMFIYTFNRPDEDSAETGKRGIYVGRRLTLLTGSNQEYLATTQLSFPTYEVSDEAEIEMPDPALLPSSACGDNDALEGYEGGLVRVENVTVPTSFKSGTEDYDDYLAYGQWPITLSTGCTLYVESAAVPEYTPRGGDSLSLAQGTLSEVWGKWIIQPREAADLNMTPSGPPGRLSRLPARPKSP